MKSKAYQIIHQESRSCDKMMEPQISSPDIVVGILIVFLLKQ
jgi:hypothetical protein